MKQIILTTVFLGCISFLIAQPTQIQQDTTQATLYYQEAMPLKDGDSLKIKLLEQAVELYEKYDLPRQIITLKSQLVFQYGKTNNPKIIELGKVTIQLAKDQLSTEIASELGFIYWGLQIYWHRIDFEKSISYGEMALKTLSEKEEGYYDVNVKLIHSYGGLGAIEKLQQFITTIEASIEKVNTQTPSNAYFSLYFGHFFLNLLNNNYQGVTRYGEQLLIEIDTKKLNYKKGFFYTQIGNGYGQLGEIDRGIDWIKRGVEIQQLADDNPVKGYYYIFLAELYYKKKSYTTAFDYLKKAINQYKIDEENRKESIGELYSQLSTWHKEIKDLKKAEEYILKSYDYTSKETYINDLNYASILEIKGNDTTALAYIQNAIIQLTPTTFNSKKIEDNPSEFYEFTDLPWICYALQRKAVAIYTKSKKEKDIVALQLAKTTSELSLKLYQKIHQYTQGYEESRLSSSGEINEMNRILQDIQYELYQNDKTSNKLENLFKITERCKALSLLETLIPSDLPKEIVQKETQLLNNIKKLEQKIITTPSANKKLINQHKTALIKETRILDKFQTEIVKQYPNQSLTFYNTQYTSISTIQASLSPNELWIEYSYNYTKTKLYIYAIHMDKIIVVQQDINTNFFNAIETIQKLLKNRLLVQQSKRKQFITTSHQLYQTLIAPIISNFDTINQLYIVPEGALFYLPFEILLPTPEFKSFEDLNYLIKPYTISYHYSATTFFNLRNLTLKRDGSLLAFAPVFQDNQELTINTPTTRDFSIDSLYRGIQNNQFKPLPFSEQEVKTIYQEQGENSKNKILLNAAATKANLIQALTQQSYQFIHIATHGLVNFKKPRASALACHIPSAEDDDKSVFLFANEILTHQVKADLVVLSSCESGIGKLIQGEGLIALSRSFIHSGAKNILFSLWKVNDKYSGKLMIDFYRNYKKDLGYATALRHAKLQMLHTPEGAIPRYWAAFILIGK